MFLKLPCVGKKGQKWNELVVAKKSKEIIKLVLFGVWSKDMEARSSFH